MKEYTSTRKTSKLLSTMSVMEKTGVLGTSFRKPYRMRGVTQASWSGVVQLVETPDSRDEVFEGVRRSQSSLETNYRLQHTN